MNIFNRVITTLLLLLLLLLALLLTVFPLETIAVARRALEGIDGALRTVAGVAYLPYLIGRIVLALLALVVFGLLIRGELRPRRAQAVPLHTATGSEAQVTTESVARRLAWHIDQLADVISVTPYVYPHGKVVNVRLDLQTNQEIDVPAKTDEVVDVARRVISERMGLQVGKIEVHIEHAPYEEAAAEEEA